MPSEHGFSASDLSRIVEAWDTKFTELRNYVEENSLRFIMGKRDLNEFDKFVGEFNAKGGKAAIDAMNQWYATKK
jgi:putative aldouronate transport system substrate-binding protein